VHIIYKIAQADKAARPQNPPITASLNTFSVAKLLPPKILAEPRDELGEGEVVREVTGGVGVGEVEVDTEPPTLPPLPYINDVDEEGDVVGEDVVEGDRQHVED